MIFLSLPLLMLLGGLGYRIRGGYLGTVVKRPGQVSRIAWGVACGIVAAVSGAPWWASLGMVPLMWATSTIGLFDAIDLGANIDTAADKTLSRAFRFWRDLALMSLRGLLAVAPAAGVLWLAGFPEWPVLVVAGLLMGPVYWAGRQLRVNIPGFGRGGDFPETGEFLFGAVVALGLFLSTLKRDKVRDPS